MNPGEHRCPLLLPTSVKTVHAVGGEGKIKMD